MLTRTSQCCKYTDIGLLTVIPAASYIHPSYTSGPAPTLRYTWPPYNPLGYQIPCHIGAFADIVSSYKVGETFLHLPLPRAQKRLARDQADVEKRLAAAADSVDDCERQMKELKVVLYAKFGKAINLDE